jgi:hypothetical protein
MASNREAPLGTLTLSCTAPKLQRLPPLRPEFAADATDACTTRLLNEFAQITGTGAGGAGTFRGFRDGGA